MNLFKDIEQIERLHGLICRKGTGTPEELANRLNTSKRNVYRLIDALKSHGFPIAYDKKRGSYFYETEVTFIFKFAVLSNDLEKVKGGQNFPNSCVFFQSDSFWHYPALSL